MLWQRVRFGILAGLVLATATYTVRADEANEEKVAVEDKKPADVKKPEAIAPPADTGKVPTPAAPVAPLAPLAPIASAPHGGPAPCFTTVTVNEMVPEYYESFRTVYKTEWREEAYTTYRTEMVPETCSRTVTFNKLVSTTVDELRTVTEYVPVCETRTGWKTCYHYEQQVTYKQKCVSLGHFEKTCKEVGPSLCDRLKKCCDPCYCPCPRYKEHCHWVCCKEYKCVPVCKCVKVCHQEPYTYTVTVCKPVCKQITVKVCKTICVPETKVETYTVCKCVKVPVTCTRKVAVCVPCQEKVTCCKMVCKQVCKQVPVCECCTPCCTPCCHKKWSFCH